MVMSGDPDPGHAMLPVPKGWRIHSRDGAGIALPYFTRVDGVSVKFATELQAWAAYTVTGARREEFGASHTPGGMMAHVDEREPAKAESPADGPEFDALFRGMLAQKLFTVGFRHGVMVTELTEKGLAALAILECVKAGTAA
jgi:hypothetical protein